MILYCCQAPRYKKTLLDDKIKNVLMKSKMNFVKATHIHYDLSHFW